MVHNAKPSNTKSEICDLCAVRVTVAGQHSATPARETLKHLFRMPTQTMTTTLNKGSTSVHTQPARSKSMVSKATASPRMPQRGATSAQECREPPLAAAPPQHQHREAQLCVERSPRRVPGNASEAHNN